MSLLVCASFTLLTQCKTDVTSRMCPLAPSRGWGLSPSFNFQAPALLNELPLLLSSSPWQQNHWCWSSAWHTQTASGCCSQGATMSPFSPPLLPKRGLTKQRWEEPHRDGQMVFPIRKVIASFFFNVTGSLHGYPPNHPFTQQPAATALRQVSQGTLYGVSVNSSFTEPGSTCKAVM